MKHSRQIRIALLALLTLPPLAASAAEQSFTRTIKLKDRLDLAIDSGAGTIRITEGPAGRLTITGHVRANDWHATDDTLRDIAANPPIMRDGSIIRIGSALQLTHVIIDYDIEAPADSMIQATAGLGDIIDDGVGQSARLSTGSGDIHATGLRGSIDVSSKGGDIKVEQSGQGEVKAISGTGSLELRNLHGALQAVTDAGSIKVSGAPAGDWTVRTGKGDVELVLGNAPCTIDARAADGLVHSDLQIDNAANSDAHHLAGRVNGGGHVVLVQASGGEIRIH